jgi:hypothetical protein
MAEQKALALINGKVSEIPLGDTIRGASGGSSSLTEYYNTDPVGPIAGQTWVRADTLIPAGASLGLLLSLTQATTSYTYQLKYRTAENLTVGVSLA